MLLLMKMLRILVMSMMLLLVRGQEDSCVANGGECSTIACCPYGYYGMGPICPSPEVCCLHQPDCAWKQKTEESRYWPVGDFALPETVYGCSRSDDTAWSTGFIRLASRLESTSDRLMEGGNSWSLEYHLRGPSSRSLFSLAFCVGLEQFRLPYVTARQPDWPAGTYCIFRMSTPCPSGFTEGNITVPTTTLDVDWIDPLPVAMTEDDVTINLCCRQDAEPGIPIWLPTPSAFALIKMGDTCQRVMYMRVFEQYFDLDLADSAGDVFTSGLLPNTTGKTDGHIRLPFCYYQEYENCYLVDDDGSGYTGYINFTKTGIQCKSREEFEGYIRYQYSKKAPNNYCGNLGFARTEPTCMVEEHEREDYTCGVPPCDFRTADYTQVSNVMPIRAKKETADIQLGVDGLRDTCTRQTSTLQAWYQINLMKVETVVAVMIYDNSGHYLCFVRLANVYVGLSENDFQDGTALQCRRNFTINGDNYKQLVRCVEPVEGQYVTLATHVYRETDMSYGLAELDLATDCLHICELEVYTENEPLDCGIPLKSSEANLRASSTAEGRESSSFWLYHHTAWCAVHDDQQPYVLVDMLWSRRVEGLWTQGDAEFTDAMVTSFTMQYGSGDEELLTYRRDPTSALVFECAGDPHAIVRHQFPHSIIARYLKLSILTWNIQPCLRLKPIVCKEQLTMMEIESVSASSAYINDLTTMYDGQMSTCAATFVEPAPWLALHLSANVLVKAVIIDTGPYYVCDPEVLSDYGEGYIGLVNSSKGFTCQRWDSQLPHNHVNTGGDDYPEGDLSRAENYCRNPDVSQHVWCYITDPSQRWVYCDIPPCVPVTLSVYVGLGLSISEVQTGRDNSLCQSVMYMEQGVSSKVTVDCLQPRQGDTVILTMSGPYDTSISACEIFVSIIEVFDHPQDTVLDNNVHYLACPTHETSIYMWFTQTPNYDVAVVVPISRSVHVLLPDQCPLYSSQCSVPAVASADEDTVYGHFGCVSRDLYGWESCSFQLSDPGEVITSLFYFDVYDSISTCTWRLQAPPGQFVMFIIDMLRLAPRETYWMEAGYKTDPGECHDHIEVIYHTNTGDVLYRSEVLSEKYEAVSSSNALTVQLHTCFRYKTILLDAEIDSTFNFTECAGCYVQSACQGGDMSCTTPCGYIIPRGYPSAYLPYTSCLWRITVDDQAFVRLRFVEFNIFEDILPPCPRDMVTVRDVSKSGVETSLGSFCNTYKPPDVLYSSWNNLVLEFVTDGELESSGFKAHYEQLFHEIDEDLVWETNSTECDGGWTLFEESCYRLFQNHELLPWHAAEAICVEEGAHLTSVMSQEEMQFIQYIMTGTIQEGDIEAYIGLQDEDGDGTWRWMDGFPLVYSNWYQSGGISQPDGGTIEACSSIRLEQLRFHKNWHDIPCATTDTNLFICKRQLSMQNVPPSLTPELITPVNEVPFMLYQCEGSGEYLLQIYQCDGQVDCEDGSDEVQQCGQQTAKTECARYSHTCADGTCISLSLVCDFQQDCADGGDEHNCVYRNCTGDEWRCASGECIPETRRCDLIPDCADMTDETTDCAGCREDVAFQCYDESCIPRAHLCDGTVDCMVRQEDEALSICGDEVQIRSCKEWRMLGHETNGLYQITLENGDLVNVECEMDATQNEVATVIHNNLETAIYVDNYEALVSYQRNLSYTHSLSHIGLIKNASKRCDQWFEFVCVSASGLVDWYISFSGKRKNYQREDDEMVDDCQCRLEKSCREGARHGRCWCILNNKGPWTDRGYFRDDDVYHDDVPILGISLSDTGQPHEYIVYTAGPLKCYEEYNMEEVIYLCNNGQSYTSTERCIYDMDEYGVMKGCRDATHLQNCEAWQCPVGYSKCPSGYCLGYWRVCDGIGDCADGEDELMCDNHECGGMLRCRDGGRCLDVSQRCDGVKQCPGGEDELFCNISCPSECRCESLSIWCSALLLIRIPSDISPETRSLDLSHNSLDIATSNLDVFQTLIELNISYNNLEELYPGTFQYQINLRRLDLSYNNILMLFDGTFVGLVNLRELVLTGNPLVEIQVGAFTDLRSIPQLTLSGHLLQVLPGYIFDGMQSLETLDLSLNRIYRLDGDVFAGLSALKSLRMDGNQIAEFEKADFEALSGLQYLVSDDHMFCCFVDVLPENCVPEKDAISSCSDLMSNIGLRVLLWILGITSLVGNFSVIAFRFRSNEKLSVSSFLVINLHISDCLMGFYMVILAGADIYYEGRYIENSLDWRNSGLCKLSGMIATVSSEMSVLTLCIITGDRLINIRFSFTEYKLRLKSASILIVITWCIVILLGVLPLFPSGYFQGVFYSRSGVCVSIHLTDEVVPGWEYSVAIFHCLNFITFVFIFLTYSYIYNFVKASGMAASAQARRKREMAVARRMTLVVVTDFCCWVPINIMGAMALSGVQIPGDVYAWIVVLVLPLNSALNPILYTISTIRVRQAQQQQEQSSFSYTTKDSSIFVRGEEWTSDEEVDLTSWIENQEKVSAGMLLAILKDLAKTIVSLQEDGLTMGKWSPEDIRITNLKGCTKTTVGCNPILIAIYPEGIYEDIETFGLVARKLLKMYTVANKKA